MVFSETTITHVTQDEFVVPLPMVFLRTTLVRNTPLVYQDISHVEKVQTRQWWALVTGVVFGLLTLWWVAAAVTAAVTGTGAEQSIMIGAAVLAFLALGLLPMLMFVRGRPFLLIGSAHAFICIPMDRKKRRVRQVIARLEKELPASCSWKL